MFFKPDKVEVQKFAYEGGAPTELFTLFAKRYVSDDKARQLVEDKAPTVESWMTTAAQNAAVHTLEQRPVYRPKDDVKGLLIKASLASATIDEDRIAVTFSIWQLTLSVLFGISLPVRRRCCDFNDYNLAYPLLGLRNHCLAGRP